MTARRRWAGCRSADTPSGLCASEGFAVDTCPDDRIRAVAREEIPVKVAQVARVVMGSAVVAALVTVVGAGFKF